MGGKVSVLIAVAVAAGVMQVSARARLRSDMRMLLARGAEREAAAVGRRLLQLVPAGRERQALAALVERLEGRTALRRLEALVLEAAARRRRGEPKELPAVVRRLERAGASVALVEWIRGELYGSWGRLFDRTKALRAIERFLGRSLSSTDLAALRSYLGERDATVLGLRERAQRAAVRLRARELVTAIVDRSAWEQRRDRLRQAKVRAERRIAVHRSRIKRLDAQLPHVGDSRRKDAHRNRRRIQWDKQQNHKAIDRAEKEIASLGRELTEVARILGRTGATPR